MKKLFLIISCFYASGFVHENHSTATVALRDDAISSSIEGITISNFWNSQEVFYEKLGANYSEHRALALLVQADQFVMEKCRLLGYQIFLNYLLVINILLILIFKVSLTLSSV